MGPSISEEDHYNESLFRLTGKDQEHAAEQSIDLRTPFLFCFVLFWKTVCLRLVRLVCTGLRHLIIASNNYFKTREHKIKKCSTNTYCNRNIIIVMAIKSDGKIVLMV